MVTYTTTYSFAKPTVGDDEDVWGGYLNGNFDTLESLLKGTTALTSINVTGNITVGGTVDGRDIATDGSKLDGIESGATADQTASEILTAIKTVDGSGSGLDADTVDGTQLSAITHSGDSVAITGAVTGSTTVGSDGSISIATTATSDPTITLTGAVTGSGTMTNLGNVSIATTATADPTLTLSGDASGSATFTNLGNATLNVTVADDSHNHVISNVDGLQTALDGKAALAGSSSQEFSARTINFANIEKSNLNSDGELGFDSSQGLLVYRTQQGTTGSVSVLDGANVDAGTGMSISNLGTGGTGTESFVFAVTSAPKWTTARTLSLSGDASGSVSWDGSANATLSVTVANDSHTHDGRYYTESEADTRFLRGNTSDTMSGNLTVDNGTSTTLSVICDDGGNAMVRAYGPSQGTGAVEVGQSSTYGGGMSYNGDGSPAFVSGETADNITFYRLENGTRTEVFHYPYNSNTVNFNATPTVSGSSVWHAGNDGSGSGLDADTVDGIQASSFLRSDASDTFTTLSGTTMTATTLRAGDGTDGRFYSDSAGRTAYADGELYIQSSVPYYYNYATNQYHGGSSGDNHYFRGNTLSGNSWSLTGAGAFTAASLDISGSVAIGAEVVLQESTDRADLLQITSSTSGWAGLQIRNSSNEGRWSFMTDGSVAGIYDDENNDWHVQWGENGGSTFYYNGVATASVLSTGFDVSGTLSTDTLTITNQLEMSNNLDMNNYDIYGVDQIFHHGDTNTYIQFHASDQFRVVTGGSERFEVNNTRTQADRFLCDAAIAEDYDALSGTSVTADPDNGGAFSLTMTGNTTFTFGAPALGSGVSTGFIIELTGNGSTVTWPTSVDWAGGTAPDAPASGETDIYVFWTRDGGTTWYGVQSIDAAA